MKYSTPELLVVGLANDVVAGQFTKLAIPNRELEPDVVQGYDLIDEAAW